MNLTPRPLDDQGAFMTIDLCSFNSEVISSIE